MAKRPRTKAKRPRTKARKPTEKQRQVNYVERELRRQLRFATSGHVAAKDRQVLDKLVRKAAELSVRLEQFGVTICLW